MSDKILVTYATRYGSTREVAEAVRTILLENGATADIMPVKLAVDVGGYAGVVLAAPFYLGAMLKDARLFLERNRAFLQNRPVALLACGPLRHDDDRAEARGQLNQVLANLAWLKPVAAEMFVGKYDPKRLRLADKLITLPPASPLHGIGACDDRDWPAIRAWAAALPAAMGLAPSKGEKA